MSQGRLLALALFALCATYGAWFREDRHALAAMLVFAMPPLVLGGLAWRGWTRAGLTAGLFALAWFSHGVLVAWTRAGDRGWAFAEILLALAVVCLASVRGLKARFGKRR